MKFEIAQNELNFQFSNLTAFNYINKIIETENSDRK